MAIKKSELYSSLWASCDELRGGMDASQYKDYVLTMLFVKYISDKYANDPYAPIQLPEGATFKEMVALVGTPNIGDDINKKILNPIKEANRLSDFPDFNDEGKLGKGKDLVDTVSNLILIFNDPKLDFSKNTAEGDDIMGDAYEFLMRHFATESGKSKGQFYTPAEVSRVLAKIVGINKSNSTAQTTVYDPACGSGSLLLKVGAEAQRMVDLYGQEKEISTANLARMNMILHNAPTASIYADNTLSRPFFKEANGNLKTFDYCVANPPFSLKSWTNGVQTDNDEYERFSMGVPPDKNGDYAFLLHIIRSLKSNGKGAVILPHGVLFRGNAEGEIRKNIIKKGLIKGIIGLPANLFYGTGIPACIIVIDKENAAHRKGIFMIDASKGFVKDGNKNRLREQDIRKITDVFNSQLELAKYSRMVPLSEIADTKNDYNLNIPRYIDSQETEDIQDLLAHVKGGIPKADIDAMATYWKAYPELRHDLFEDIDSKYVKLRIPEAEIKQFIFSHGEFQDYHYNISKQFKSWATNAAEHLKTLDIGCHPKEEVQLLGQQLLQVFADNTLINEYDVYQHLMDYWNQAMQDDLYLVSLDGWQAGKEWTRHVTITKAKKEGAKDKEKVTEGLAGVIGRMLSAELLVEQYFADESRAITALQNDAENAKANIAEIEEEQNTEGGLFEDLEKVNAGEVKKLLKAKKTEKAPKEEIAVLDTYLANVELVSKLTARLKEVQAALEKKVIALYPTLTEDDIKHLVVDVKWMQTIQQNVMGEMERISQRLAQRIKELAERYHDTLPQLEEQATDFEGKVKQHLLEMGIAW
jgi:type I restriction enzyme M protein